MQTSEPDRLLSREEVESQFGLTKRFLELATARGDGPAYVRLGRSVRYRDADIREWIAGQRIHPTQP